MCHRIVADVVTLATFVKVTPLQPGESIGARPSFSTNSNLTVYTFNFQIFNHVSRITSETHWQTLSQQFETLKVHGASFFHQPTADFYLCFNKLQSFGNMMVLNLQQLF